jgi:hypothetical protein
MRTLYDNTSPFAIVACAAPDAPVSPGGNGADPKPPPISESKRAGKAKLEMVTAAPGEAAPPPPMPDKTQRVTRKLDLDGIRKTRAQVTPQTPVIIRIPAIDRPGTEPFFRVHPIFGGIDDPMPVWKREGLGKGGSGLRLVSTDMVGRIRALGGKVALSALYWGQYSVGGQFVVVVSVESDNDWIASKRQLLEQARGEWLKMVNAGNCWQKVSPPVTIPEPKWADLTWDDVLNLSFDDQVSDENHPDFRELMYGSTVMAAVVGITTAAETTEK